MNSGSRLGLALGALALLFLTCTSGEAIPAFARKYKTSCSTCHYAYPRLNGFGKAFRNNGFRYPEGQDEEMTKEKPVKLGSEGQKRAFPDAIWPSDIPGTIPLSIHAVGQGYVRPDSKTMTSFRFPDEVEFLYGGTLGETFSMLGEVEVEAGEEEGSDVETAFPFIFQYDFRPELHIKMGNVSPDITWDHLRITANHYNVSSLYSRHMWRLRNEQGGVEVWGAHNGPGGRGGLTYATGVVNGQNPEDNNEEKDVYVWGAYKYGGLGEIGGTEGQASSRSAFYEDDSAKIGGFLYLGNVPQEGEKKEDLTVAGFNYDFWYRRFNVFGTFMSMNSDISGLPDRTSLAWFTEGHYVLFPWLIGVTRFEITDVDDSDGRPAIKTIIPQVLVMARADIRYSLEYKWPLDDASKDTDELLFQMNYAF